MLKLDNNLLNELGLGALPEEQKRSMLQHIYDTLELRVGTRLANQMTDEQLQEFEKFIDAGGDNNQAQALQWLETNLPNYKQVVNDVFEELKAEIKQMAPQIMASTASAPAQAQPVQPNAPAVDPMAQQQTAQPAPAQMAQPQPMAPMQDAPAYAQPQPMQPVQPATASDPYAQAAQPAQPTSPTAPQFGMPQAQQSAQPFPAADDQQQPPMAT